jgi:outer membrane receptor protein involved in Fe transport
MIMKRISLFLILAFFTAGIFAQQNKISGTVTDSKNEPLAGVNIIIKGTDRGTVSDFDGKFSLTPGKFPVTLVFSYLGYKTEEKTFHSPVNNLKVVMQESAETLDELVITASRTAERLRESPVTIEMVTAKQIEYASAPTFYDDLVKLRGVQMNTNSLTFQAINTRGFATFANNRFLQIIDGIDNSSPALNFPLGNLVGINDLDVASVELLPGTSSALYGANAFNGLLYIRSKNPFDYPGLSTSVKFGVTKQEFSGTNPMYQVAVRYAKAGEKLGFKVNFSYLNATDWMAKDYRDFDFHPRNAALRGSRESNPSYDGLNIYGDEVATDIDLTGIHPALGVIRVSRTGYEEVDLTDYQAKSMKGDFAVHFRPKGNDSKMEIIWLSRFGMGQTIYQGTNRYNLKDLFLHQHKLELKDENYFVRAYYTSEDAGKSYDMRFAAINVNRKWKSDVDWFTQYAQAYAIGILVNGLTPGQAHAVARQYADTGRYEPGSDDFKKAFDEVVDDPNFSTGAKFVDKTSLFHIEGNYDFKNLIENGLIQLGGSYRQFSLNSQGTIFTDYDGPIHIKEKGAYVQYIQKLLDGHVKFTTSLRYDQQDRLKANFSPRIAMVVMPDADKKHSFRVAYQTGFRNPTTQDWYIGLDVGRATLVGAHPDNWDRYEEDIIVGNNTVTITGRDAYTNAYTLESVLAFAQAGDPSLLEIAEVKPLGAEKIQSFEVGYRGPFLAGWNLDVVGYHNWYNNFITQQVVMAVPKTVGDVHDMSGIVALAQGAAKPFGVYTNVDVPIKSYGLDINLGKKINGYDVNLIYSHAKMDFDKQKYPDYKTFYNTPENSFKFILGKEELFENFGFNFSYTHMTKFLWEATFATDYVPARNVFDAMVSYKIPKYNLMLKAGGSNIFGPDYMVAPGTGKVGSIYYFSLLYKM